jgi:hypothetical protein
MLRVFCSKLFLKHRDRRKVLRHALLKKSVRTTLSQETQTEDCTAPDARCIWMNDTGLLNFQIAENFLFQKLPTNQRNIMKKLELTGKKFGKLKVLGEGTPPDSSPFTHWDCRCDCGNKVTVRGVCLKHGNSTSCGCSRQVEGFNARTLLTYKGKTQSLSAWARAQGMSRSALSVRLHRGWELEKALTTPVRKRAANS